MMFTPMLTQMLTCFGDLCVDLVARSLAAPAPGEDATVEHMAITMAGGAANCAVAAASAGIAVELIGLVGTDALGDAMLAHLTAAGVGTSHVLRSSAPTGMVVSIVQPGGERTLYSYRGANAEAYGPLPEHLGNCVYLSGYSFQTESSRQTALELKARAKMCALDPSFQFARDFRCKYRDVLPGLHFLLPNREEARLMTDEDSVERTAAALRAMGVGVVVIKLGTAGCFVDTGTLSEYVPVEPLESVADSTGAGDTFCGAFLAAILDGCDEIEAAQRGNRAARKRLGG